MRLAAQEKVGFYPTPTVVVELLSSWLKPQGFWRLLDPCCGAGEAAALLAERIGGEYETWGVEIAPDRANEAATRLSRVHNAAWQHVRVEKGTVSLLWLNPPYDYDDHDQRVELEFLRTGIPTLAKGGVLVYIVPQRLLGYKTCAQALAGHFEQLVIRRFPGETYDLFRQVVVLGRKRQTYHHPTEQEIAAIRSLADSDLEELMAVEEPQFPVPPAPRTARFSLVVSPANLQVASAAALPWPEAMSAFLRRREQDFRPALPLRKGHIAMLMSGGLLGKVRLTDPDGSKLLAKGMVVKQVDTQVEEGETGEGKPKTTVIRRERFATTVVAVKETGEVVLVEDTDRLTEFMEQYGAQLAEQILRRKPLYDLQPTREEWETVSALGKSRKPLPGQKDAGLLDVQKHVAIGAARVCRKYRSAIIQGEMGVGKTTIGLAALELLDGFPAIVLCPPHLAPKWCREAQEVLPGVHVAEIRSISDVDRLVEGWKNGVLGKRVIAVLASTTAKLGSGWKNTPALRYTLPEEKAERRKFRAALRRYKALKDQGSPEEVAAARREALEAAVPYPVCPRCGSALMDEKGNPVSVADLGRKPLKCTACGAPLYDFGQGNYHRWPIAEYVSRKHRGVFRTLVADEVHEYKSRDSDRGLAFQRLVGATRYHLALTGTLYGGKATSIFWLLHRLGVGNVQRDFAYDDERRWVDLYGVWETREVYSGKAETYGVYNATCRRQVSVQEKPGVSPAILTRIVGQTIFVDLADLGVALPPYQESYGPVAMTDEQGAQYRALDSTLRSLAVRDRRYLSIWLQWTLSRPNSAFRDEAVVRPHVVWEGDGRTHAGGAIAEVIFDLPAVVEDGALLPKEAWLADFVRSETLLGRKSLVYVRQSDTRDIQPRLRQVLERAGVRVAILNAGTDPRKREEWIAKNVDGIDCLLCNPLLVQTGLDLVGFCNAVYYEPQYSLYVLWQSMRRVWRLGQTNPVKVVFLGYKGTMEEAALRLIGQKIRAAQLLFGKEVVGAIVPEDDGNFLYELARTVLEGKKLPDLTTLFAARVVETPSPLGSPTVPSPEITIRVSAPYKATQTVLPGFEGLVVSSSSRKRR